MPQWQYWDEISLLILLMISLIFSIFINIHKCANYANMIICIFDHGMKDQRLSFHLVQTLVIYGLVIYG